MIHNQTASVMSLARTVLQGVDPKQTEARVSSATLILLLETLIDLGTPAHQMKASDQAQRTVAGHMASLNGARDGR